MFSFCRSADCSKEKIAKLKSQLCALTAESRKLERLIEITRPAKMPEIKSVTNEENKERTPSNKPSNLHKSGTIMIGKMFSRGIGKIKPIAAYSQSKELSPVAEDKQDQARSQLSPQKFKCDKDKGSKVETKLLEGQEKNNEKYDGDASTRVTLDSNVASKMENNSDSTSIEGNVALKITDVIGSETSVNIRPKKHKLPKHKVIPTFTKGKNNSSTGDKKLHSKNIHKTTYGELSEHDDKYSTWLPPKNQSGDGRTNLNDKYGY